ncbi:MAG: T9SS type A sorting domain-containing protein [Candidatus Marinimicrobia bacterium]|nr:T9SS type A sorting domain-containing protein [Candidatus Neomarinimicrobiota bacterium]
MKLSNRILAFLLIVGIALPLSAVEPEKVERYALGKPAIQSTGAFDGNRINTDLENNGMIVSHRISGHSGFEWPQGNATYAIYASGLWMAGKVDGEIRTAVAEYEPEFTAGTWESEGDDPNGEYRLYKVNKVDMNNPAANPDFAAWPVDQGAPWIDEDGDGVYTPMPGGVDHPDFIGDQVMFFVMMDGVGTDHSVFSTDPLGLEIQTTIWGYNRNDAFGDMMFVKSRIFNKGGNDITDTYLGLWSDPDLGDASDDFVGCDTALSLGITYNDGADSYYGTGAPAIGYDFFQAAFPSGDITDTTWAFDEYRAGYSNQQMSSFVKYINGDDVYTDPNDADEAYNYLSGFLRDGTPFINSATGLPSKFVHMDDPNDNVDANDDVWVDGDDNPSDDRRFLMNVGPFDFDAGAEAEVVYGIIMSQGSDALASVTKLKEDDILAQKAYDVRFALPDPPASPELEEIVVASGAIVLEWSDNAEDYYEWDNFTETYYEYEGYNVYQFENAIGTGVVKKIASYDLVNDITTIEDIRYVEAYGANVLVPVQKGTDSGLRHTIAITSDAIGGGIPLVDDRTYYFAVTAYGYGEVTEPHMLESAFNIIEARSQTNVYIDPNSTVDTDLAVTHTTSTIISDGSVEVTVTNPGKLTGHDYSVTFDTLTFVPGEDPVTVWNLNDVTAGTIVLANQIVQGGIDSRTGIEVGSAGTVTADGLQVVVNGPSNGIHGVWQTSNADGPIAGIDDDVNENVMWINFLTAPDYPTSQAQIADGGWFFVTHGGGTPSDMESFYARVFRGSNFSRAIPNDFEMRFTAAGGFGYGRFSDGIIRQVPFELWNLRSTPDDPSDDYRMLPAVLPVSDSDEFGFYGDDLNSSAANDPATDWVYWGDPNDKTPGQAGYDAFFAPGLGGLGDDSVDWTEVIARTRLMNWNGYVSRTDSVALSLLSSTDSSLWTAADTTIFLNAGFFIDADNNYGVVEPDLTSGQAYGTVLLMPEIGTTFRWITNKPNGLGDLYSFTTDGYGAGSLTYDPDNVKVWPNPYFGYNPEERTPLSNEINFINLPETATINIYSLAGQLVRTLDHSGGQEETWNAQNSFNVLVASGVYLAVISSDEGEDKVLKLAVVMPAQRLDVY